MIRQFISTDKFLNKMDEKYILLYKINATNGNIVTFLDGFAYYRSILYRLRCIAFHLLPYVGSSDR